MKMTSLLLVLALTAVLSTACGQAGTKPEANNSGQGSNAETAAAGTAETVVKPAPQDTKIKLTVHYYVSDAELSALKEYTTGITVAKNEEKYMAAIKALQLEKEPGAVSLWKNAKFLSAVLKDGKLTVDLSLPDEARLGAPGEQMALDAIQRTAFQFKEVTSLDLLVDGKAVDSLMGHSELDHPIVRSS